jgi:TonB family protein
MPVKHRFPVACGAALLAFAVACGDDPAPAELRAARPVANAPEIPYPPALFEQRVEGEVMLYLVVDSAGQVVRDSTRIETSSGHPDFDAAAMAAAPGLKFHPATRNDTAVMAPIQVPIRFRLPDSLRSRTPGGARTQSEAPVPPPVRVAPE